MVVGVGLILAWNQPFWPATPYGTWGILLLSYTCLLLPYPVRYVGAALAQIGPNLEAAARVHGASAARALRRIVLPLVLPALAASMLMVFAVASRELVTSLRWRRPACRRCRSMCGASSNRVRWAKAWPWRRWPWRPA